MAVPDGVLRRARHPPQVQRALQVVPALLVQRHRQVHLRPEPRELRAEEVLQSLEERPHQDNRLRLAVEAVAAEDQQHQAFRALLPAVRAEDLDVRPASCT